MHRDGIILISAVATAFISWRVTLMWLTYKRKKAYAKWFDKLIPMRQEPMYTPEHPYDKSCLDENGMCDLSKVVLPPDPPKSPVQDWGAKIYH